MEDGAKTKEELIRELALLRQRSAAFEQAEEKHRLLIENSHDIIYTMTPGGIFSFVSTVSAGSIPRSRSCYRAVTA